MVSKIKNLVQADNIVIGSGAGGATIFDRLSAAGKDVLLLEEGDWMLPGDKAMDVPFRIQKFYRNAGLNPILGIPPVAYGEGVAVGGSTEVNGGLLWFPPTGVIESWKLNGGVFAGYSNSELLDTFSKIEKDLNVVSEEIKGGDTASKLLYAGAHKFGLTPVPARRAVINCKKRNECAAGCSISAKQSMSTSYIPRGLSQGGRLLVNRKVLSVQKNRHGVEVICKNTSTGHVEKYFSKNLFLAAGTLNSPSILSKYLDKPISTQLGIHLNLKVIVRFNTSINAEKGTIFTHQIQDYLDDGMLLMTSNFRPSFLGIALAAASNETRQEIIDSYDNIAIYTIQIRPSNLGKLMVYKNMKFPLFMLSEKDSEKIKYGIQILSKLLFSIGAEKMWLPTGNLTPAINFESVDNVLSNTKISSWQLSTVHAMSSLPVGDESSRLFDNLGKLKSNPRIRVSDASGLPSLVGESPQGAIMLFADHVARSFLAE